MPGPLASQFPSPSMKGDCLCMPPPCPSSTSGRRPAARSGSHRIAGTSSPARGTANGIFRTLLSRSGAEVTLQYPVSPVGVGGDVLEQPGLDPGAHPGGPRFVQLVDVERDSWYRAPIS
jgi:hypothetical protein